MNLKAMYSLFLGTALLFPTALAAQNPVYRVNGEFGSDGLGYSVSNVGDVNLDGCEDFLAGARSWDDKGAGGTDNGRVYVYSGRNGMLLMTRNGEKSGDRMGDGTSIAAAGDWDLDGFPDFLAGSYAYDDATNNTCGRVYVFSGKDGSALFTRDGDNAGDSLGYSVAAADLNLDGHQDLVAGAEQWMDPNGSNRGRAYAISGKDGSVLFTLEGENGGDGAGHDVFAADVNLDGYGDAIVSASSWSSATGRVYAVSGLNGSLLFTVDGESTSSLLGYAVGAIDVNADGYTDLLSAAYGWSSGQGRVYAHSGQDGTLVKVLEGEAAGQRFGYSVAGADLSGDGFGDVLVGAYNYGATSGFDGRGRAYVYSGANGSLLLAVDGENQGVSGGAGDSFGISISEAGDISGDGQRDFVVGGYRWDDPVGPKSNCGRAYVVSGVPLALSADNHLLSIAQASTQNLALDGGLSLAGKQYWVFGNFMVSGSTPGVTLGAVNIPLNPDPWTQLTIDFANTAALFQTKGVLDGSGQASASLNSLAPQPAAPLGLTLQHCYLVYQSGPPDIYSMASNLVPWTTAP